MEVCREGLQEEYEIQIHIGQPTNFYDLLRFGLLGGKWLPRPVGVCLWSLIQILLAVLHTISLPLFFIFLFVGAVCLDIFLFAAYVPFIALFNLFHSLCLIVVALASWSWHLIRCFLPGRTPGQSLVHSIFFGGRPLAPGAALDRELCEIWFVDVPNFCRSLLSCGVVRMACREFWGSFEQSGTPKSPSRSKKSRFNSKK